MLALHFRIDIEPFRCREKDVIAAKKVDTLLNRVFIEPLLGLGYPYAELKVLKRIEKFIKQNDEHDLAFNMDFIGLQNYTREIVVMLLLSLLLKLKLLKQTGEM